MDLTCLGIILVDMFPMEIGKPLVEVEAFSPKPGGAPANVAVAAKRLGASTAFIGKVGEDLFGHWLKDILEKEGVETTGMSYAPDARTTMAFIAMPDENHAEFVFYRNPGADTQLRESDLDVTLLQNSKALHFDSLSLTHERYFEASLKAIEIVKKAGGFISFDVNYRPTMWRSPEDALQAAKAVLPLCDVVKVNETELILLTGEPSPETGGEAILDLGGKLCLITLGEKGAYYQTRFERGYMPAFKVKTIDAIGCGDAFLGAILQQLTTYPSLTEALEAGKMEEIVRFAAAAGALTSTKRGALPAIPHRSEVEAFLSEQQ